MRAASSIRGPERSPLPPLQRRSRGRRAARARRRAATISPGCAATSAPTRRATSRGRPWRAATSMLTKQFAGDAGGRAVARLAAAARRAGARAAPVAARGLGARRRARRRALRPAPARRRDRPGARRRAPRRLPAGAGAVSSRNEIGPSPARAGSPRSSAARDLAWLIGSLVLVDRAARAARALVAHAAHAVPVRLARLSARSTARRCLRAGWSSASRRWRCSASGSSTARSSAASPGSCC